MKNVSSLTNKELTTLKQFAAYREYERLNEKRPIGNFLTGDGTNLIFKLRYNEQAISDLKMMFGENARYDQQSRQWFITPSEAIKAPTRTFTSKWNVYVTDDALDMLKAI